MPDKPPNPKPRSTRDPEIDALGKIDMMLSKFPAHVRARMLDWLQGKHVPDPQPEDGVRDGLGPA